MLIYDQFGIIHNLHMSPIPQSSFFVGTFFAIPYSKRALAWGACKHCTPQTKFFLHSRGPLRRSP